MKYPLKTMFEVTGAFGGYALDATSLSDPYSHVKGSYIMLIGGYSLSDNLRTMFGLSNGVVVRFLAADGTVVDAVSHASQNIDNAIDGWVLGRIKALKQ